MAMTPQGSQTKHADDMYGSVLDLYYTMSSHFVSDESEAYGVICKPQYQIHNVSKLIRKGLDPWAPAELINIRQQCAYMLTVSLNSLNPGANNDHLAWEFENCLYRKAREMCVPLWNMDGRIYPSYYYKITKELLKLLKLKDIGSGSSTALCAANAVGALLD